jgi:predicted transcriptional regulator
VSRNNRKGGRKGSHTSGGSGESRTPSKASLSPKQKQVLQLLRREMQKRGYHPAEIEAGQKLWLSYAASTDPNVRKPAVYAAALEYLVAEGFDSLDVTQKELADLYGVSAASVSKTCNRMLSSPYPPATAERFADTALHKINHSRKRKREKKSSVSAVNQKSTKDGPNQQRRERERLAFLSDKRSRTLLRNLAVSRETWVCGRRQMNATVMHPQPFQPDIFICLEKQSQLVLGAVPFDPTEGHAVEINALIGTMLKPMIGGPRRPHEIVLEDPELVDLCRPLFADLSIAIKHAPSELIDHVIKALNTATAMRADEQKKARRRDGHTANGGAKHDDTADDATDGTDFVQSDRRQSYLDGDRISVDIVGAFFRSAARLLKCAPWSVAADHQVVQIRLNRWNRASLCVSIIGGAGLDRGLLIFKSFHDFLSYAELAEAAAVTGISPSKIGIELLSVNYDRPADLHPDCLKEVLRHGWQVEAADAYPWLMKIGPDSSTLPIVENDYRIAAACAEAVAGFVTQHKEVFTDIDPEIVEADITLSDWPQTPPVHVVAPHPEI